MLDHEEKFLFKEEILQLANAVAEPGILDNVEDLLTANAVANRNRVYAGQVLKVPGG